MDWTEFYPEDEATWPDERAVVLRYMAGRMALMTWDRDPLEWFDSENDLDDGYDPAVDVVWWRPLPPPPPMAEGVD